MERGDKLNKLQELDMEAYAAELEKSDLGDKRYTLRDIFSEISVCFGPFVD